MLEKAKKIGVKSKKAYYQFLGVSSKVRNQVLDNIAEKLIQEQANILSENKKDLALSEKNQLSSAMLDRLTLNPSRIQKLSDSVREIMALPDPLGEVVNSTVRENGIVVHQERVPLGSVMVIFESRPNVVIDIASLSIKSGNACILRGGKEAIHTNQILGKVVRDSLVEAGLDANIAQIIETPDRDLVSALLQCHQEIDIVVPRGGSELIQFVSKNSQIPVIKHDAGICHVYIDEDADIDMAVQIAVNAKAQRPGVCNAMETLVMHESFPGIKQVIQGLRSADVALRGDQVICALDDSIEPATEEDWNTEYLDLILSIKMVKGISEAIDFINTHSSNHTEAIVSNNYNKTRVFQNRIDSACVHVNCSTRFSDGGEFGLGAEVGISTQKLHVRGPMGIKDLTCLKYKVYGNGQTRS